MRAPIYFPTTTDPSWLERTARAHGATVERLRVNTDIELVGVRRTAAAGRPTLLFFGGNAMSITDSVEVLSLITDNTGWGIAVWAYRGYDGSGGSPAEEDLYADAALQIRHLDIPPEGQILVGQSLGTGIAVHLANALSAEDRAPAGVILISPYTSIRAVADELFRGLPVGWLLSDRYESEAKLPGVASPVVVIHGTEDEVINIKHGRAVAAALGDRAQLVEVAGAGHNDIWLFRECAQAARDFVERTVHSAE